VNRWLAGVPGTAARAVAIKAPVLARIPGAAAARCEGWKAIKTVKKSRDADFVDRCI
jgi:hypothetical protein